MAHQTTPTFRAAFTLLVVAIFAYELIAIYTKTPGATITEIIRDHTFDRPIIPFFAGLLCGHFFWR